MLSNTSTFTFIHEIYLNKKNWITNLKNKAKIIISLQEKLFLTGLYLTLPTAIFSIVNDYLRFLLISVMTITFRRFWNLHYFRRFQNLHYYQRFQKLHYSRWFKIFVILSGFRNPHYSQRFQNPRYSQLFQKPLLLLTTLKPQYFLRFLNLVTSSFTTPLILFVIFLIGCTLYINHYKKNPIYLRKKSVGNNQNP